jgi:hypothetical protein
MFADPSSGCSWETFLGPRTDSSMYGKYIQDCLAGCAPASFLGISPMILIILFVMIVMNHILI